MERKEFIKASCSLCILLGAGALISSLDSCGTSLAVYKTDIQDNKVTVPVSLFTSQQELQIVRARGYEYDIAVRKSADNIYTALLLTCTHAENPLNSTGSGYICNLHGSTFDKTGAVTKGPAEHPLKSFTTSVINDTVVIKLS